MKKNYTLTAFFISMSLLASAQTAPAIAWQKCIGGSGYDNNGLTTQTADGGYIIAGETNSNDGDITGNHGNGDCGIAKVNSSGIIQWSKSFGGSDVEQIYSIRQTSDGGSIFIGYTQSNNGDVSGNHGGGDIWLVKLSDIGVIEWQKCLGGNRVDIGLSVEQTPDGGYIISGVTDSNDGDVTGNHDPLGIQPDIWIAKLGSVGAVQWQNCFGGTEDDYGGITQTSDGGYIIAGSTNSTDGDVTGNHGGGDMWVFKLNSSGILQWEKAFGGSGGDFANSLVLQTADGNYLIAGYTSSSDGDITGDHSSGDYWIVKLDNSGNILWQKFYGGSGSDYAGAITSTSDGGYIVSGYSNSNDGDVIGNHGAADIWLLKLTGSGDLQWQKCMGGTNDDGAQYTEETSDHGYIIGGTSSSNDGDVSGNHGFSDYWLVKLEPDVLLPVTLLNFSGEVNGKQNLLHWTTATEQNNTGFEVQRSSDENNFNKIGFVNTKAVNGNSNLKLNYDFSDIGFAAATNYYRLKQVDKDGKFSYSNIVVLKDINAIADGAMEVFPNPVHNTLNIKIAVTDNKNVRFSITNVSGKEILNKSSFVSNGETVIHLDVSRLAAGTYFLKLTSADGSEKTVKKFVKQ